jgi:RNA polymerase sigma factor (sigma-70 family)
MGDLRGHSFEETWRQHARSIESFAAKLVYDWDLRQEILQRARIKAWGAFQEYDRGRSFVSWVCKILMRVFLDERRAETRGPVRLSLDKAYGNSLTFADVITDDFDLEADATGRSQAEEILNLVHDYDDRTLLLRIAEDDSYEEAAEFLGITVPMVRSRLYRLRTGFTRSRSGAITYANPQIDYKARSRSKAGAR